MPVRIAPVSELGSADLAEWLRLQQINPILQSPFLCPEFVTASATVRPGVVALVAEEQGIAKAILPLQMRRSLAGPVACPLSDYQALIAPRDWQCDLQGALRNAGIKAYDFMYHIPDQRIDQYRRRVIAAPTIMLDQGFAAYVAEIKQRVAPANMSGKPHQILKRIAHVERRHGPVRFEWHESNPAALNQLFEWKSAQYRRGGAVVSPIDCFSFPWTRLLLERIHSMQSPTFAGVLSTLHIGDNLVAVHMGMRSQKVLHWWFPAYDPAFGKLSPGLILLTKLSEAAAQKGIRQVDLGPGDEAYKKLVANSEQKLAGGFISCGIVPTFSRLAVHYADLASTRLPIGTLGTWPGRLMRRVQREGWLGA
jgi:CelD/BcsL family acetyltransferase involved in cellulose biosynthesis